jgi:toxin-antitoxin system PIN domain toxin
LRLLTNRAVLGAYGLPPLTNSEAWAVYRRTRVDDRVKMQSLEPDGIESQWREFSLRTESAPKLWMDAYLAAFAVTGAITLVTTDGAFSQFSGLELVILGSQD